MSQIHVRRLRVSYVAGRVHDRVREIGGDQAFARRLTDLEAVAGVPVELPFGAHLAPDSSFWESIVERDPAGPTVGTDGEPLPSRGPAAAVPWTD